MSQVGWNGLQPQLQPQPLDLNGLSLSVVHVGTVYSRRDEPFTLNTQQAQLQHPHSQEGNGKN